MSENRVKLVAIAKDEAAYLPEWIFHHLYFGFDSIDIYINNTSDNSLKLTDMLASLDSVNFKDGDFFFNNFNYAQRVIYQYSLSEAREEGFTHIIFLDIDEFWTPRCFYSNIKQCIQEISADIISFEWFNKFENQCFSSAIECNMVGEHHSLVKSLLSLDIEYCEIDIHNSKSEKAVYRLADGGLAIYHNNNQHVKVDSSDIKPYFITHRMFRSQLEYVSLLGRGRPNKNGYFKDNRNGFYKVENTSKKVIIDENTMGGYFLARNEFYERYITTDYIDNANRFIVERYNDVVRQIDRCSISELTVLKKILNGVDLPDVNQAFASYLARVARILSKDVVDSIRDAAIALENRDLAKSLQLMELALSMRPQGPLLVKKVKQYREKLEKA